jgi:hypothetical protein
MEMLNDRNDAVRKEMTSSDSDGDVGKERAILNKWCVDINLHLSFWFGLTGSYLEFWPRELGNAKESIDYFYSEEGRRDIQLIELGLHSVAICAWKIVLFRDSKYCDQASKSTLLKLFELIPVLLKTYNSKESESIADEYLRRKSLLDELQYMEDTLGKTACVIKDHVDRFKTVIT